MVLMMARQEAGLSQWWRKTLKRKMENNYRKSRDLFKNKHGDSLERVNVLFLRG
jgi:hypothetical protein